MRVFLQLFISCSICQESWTYGREKSIILGMAPLLPSPTSLSFLKQSRLEKVSHSTEFRGLSSNQLVGLSFNVFHTLSAAFLANMAGNTRFQNLFCLSRLERLATIKNTINKQSREHCKRINTHADRLFLYTNSYIIIIIIITQ